jgi:hypothetical protein
MQTSLKQLHRKLAQVARRRRWSRRAAGCCAAAVAVLWTLAVAFLLDLTFELDVIQRLIVLTLAAAVLCWAFVRFVRPWFGVRETESDLALMMEQRHHIDNDLIAALQFESADTARWGSVRLQQSVIDSASSRGEQLDVRHTAHGKQTLSRSALLAASMLAVVGVCLLFPQHVATFLHRLTLANTHYPAKTVLEAVVINGDLVMTPNDESTPRETRSAENEPVWFVVRCCQDVPKSGEVVARGSEDRSIARVPLEQISSERRLAAFEAVIAVLNQPTHGEGKPMGELVSDDLALVESEVPEVRTVFVGTQPQLELTSHVSQIRQHCEAAVQSPPTGIVFVGRLPEMVESLRYQIYLGDAWTNRSAIEMIPLPVVEPQFDVKPPDYAVGEEEQATYTGASSFTVLTGSQIRVRVLAVNSKPLASVTMRVRASRGVSEYTLVRDSRSGTQWSLPVDCEALRSVTEELQYEIVAQDHDGLRPREPVLGQIRVRPDLPPTALMQTVHRVVLPMARPKLVFRIDDDHSVARLRLGVEIERSNKTEGSRENVTSAEIVHFDVTSAKLPLGAVSLPYRGAYSLDLSNLNVSKGDELKLTLEATDGRGRTEGIVTFSEPLFLEVSDEAGVLAAISEPDSDAERRLDEMIQQQLDAGEGG